MRKHKVRMLTHEKAIENNEHVCTLGYEINSFDLNPLSLLKDTFVLVSDQKCHKYLVCLN